MTVHNFIKKFKFMHQNDDYSCGKICTYMVIAAFGERRRKLLRWVLKTDWNLGTFQKDLIKALRYQGFSCHVKSFVNTWWTGPRIIREFKSYFNNGYLAVACVDNNQHWIVVRGIKGNRVYVADPDLFGPEYHTLTKFIERIKLGSVVFVKKD